MRLAMRIMGKQFAPGMDIGKALDMTYTVPGFARPSPGEWNGFRADHATRAVLNSAARLQGEFGDATQPLL
jgi:hypothetical protein